MEQDKRLFICDKDGNPAIQMNGINMPGTYVLYHNNGGDPDWSVRCKLVSSPSIAENPLVVVFPGYRMRGVEGYACNKAADRLNKMGFPALIFDYGGTGDNKSEEADLATMTTQIADTRALLSYLGGRKHIQFAISYGVNVSMQVMTPDTLAVVGVVPVPDMAQKIMYPRIDQAAIRARGYTRCPSGTDVPFKITAAFLDDSLNYTTFDPALARAEHKPPIHLILAANDQLSPPSYINSWVGFLQQSGYDVETTMIPDQSHLIDKRLLMQSLRDIVSVRDRILEASHSLMTAQRLHADQSAFTPRF